MNNYNESNESNEVKKETTIIQNITLGYHFVSDIKLQWGPKEVKDLTWEKPELIKNSKDLKDSLRAGILRQLSEQEYQKTLDLQYKREKKQLLLNAQNQMHLENVSVDGVDKEFLADTFDVSKARKTENEFDITGTANHPLSYVAAFEIAQARADLQGELLTAEEFSILVEKNPQIVPHLLKESKASSEREAHTVYYSNPPGEFGKEAGVIRGKMNNIQSGHEINSSPMNYENILSKIDMMDEDISYRTSNFDIETEEDIVESIDISSDEIIIPID